MILQNYQVQAKRTCPSLGSEKLDLAHMVLGIISEQEEFLKANISMDQVNQKEELADICWYIANYCTFRGFDFKKLVEDNQYGFEYQEQEDQVCTFDLFSSKLADYVKKYIAYNKPLDQNLELRALGGIIYSLTLEECNFSFDKDLENNINKLKIRFPDKFTEENALNRDLESERKELER